MKKIFLESHNIDNRASGLGTFNQELVKAFAEINPNDLQLILNSKHPERLQKQYGPLFQYHKYSSLQRHPIFRIRKKHDLWHSLNQNTKIEPFRTSKYLLTVHDVNFVEEISSDMQHRNNKLFIAKLKRSDAITYISEFARKQTHQYFDVPKVPEYIIYNGNPITTILDTRDYSTTIPKDRPFIYSIGDFQERKNFLSLVKMIALMPDINLVLSGNDSHEYGTVIKEYIRDNKLEHQVFLTGKVDEAGKQFFLQHCLAFAFPSIREGFGLPPIEAMRFGKPVFLSNYTSLPEIGGEDAYYWDNFDPEYMKEIVVQGLNHFNQNEAIVSQKMKERAAFFDWKKAASEYLNVYRSILER